MFEKKYDVLHLQWYKMIYFDFFFYFILKKKFQNTKFVFTAHNLLPHDKQVYRKIYELFYKVFDKIIVHDENTKGELIKEFNIKIEKVKVIRHGLINIEANKEKVSEIIDITKKITKNRLVLSFLGNICQYKGIHKVIKLWESNAFIKNNNDIILIVAGKLKIDQAELERIKEAENVFIKIGNMSNEEFLAYTKISDLIILPYEKISQSGLLLTAMAEKIPVLVSKVNGLIEPFEFANPGWIIENSFEMSIKYIINNRLEIKKIKENEKMWSRIQRYYSWNTISLETEKLYHQ
jgi:glycosyltransferase involved in cell wall biosynthesis